MSSRPPTLTNTNEGSRILFCHLCEFEILGYSNDIDLPCWNCERSGFITVKGDSISDEKKKEVKKLRKELWG